MTRSVFVSEGWEYASAVANRNIPASDWVQLQCEKSLREYREGTEDWYFDDAKA